MTEDRLSVFHTRGACPLCGFAVIVNVAPEDCDLDGFEDAIDAALKQYDMSFPSGWTEDYERPVAAFCDHPFCEWQDSDEWSEVAPDVLAMYRSGDAPFWDEIMEELK